MAVDGRKWKRTIAYGVISLLLLAILAAATFRSRSDRPDRQQYQIVTLGDSVFGRNRDDTGIPQQLGTLLGKTVFNGAFGGTCTGRIGGEGQLAHAGDALSLVGVTSAIAADDFGVQQTVRMRGNGTEYFESTVDGLEQIDFSRVELMVVMHGLNDYYSGVPLYNEEDPLDAYSFTGALRRSLAALQKANPNMRILLVTPTYTWNHNTGQTCEEYDVGFGVAEDYVYAEIEVAKEMGVEVIDMYHDVFPHGEWNDWSLYTIDGMHPNEQGRDLIAGIIYEYLQENL